MRFQPDPNRPARLERVQELTLRRWTAAEISAELGLAYNTVVNYRQELKRAGRLGRSPGPGRDASSIESALTLKRRGDLSNVEIARRIGVNERTVLRWFSEARRRGELPEIPPNPPLTVEMLETARTMLENRSGYAEASRTLGVGIKRLRRRLPGHALGPDERLERAIMGQEFSRLPDHLERVKDGRSK